MSGRRSTWPRPINLGDFASAIDWFKRRVEMGGDEETYYAKHQMAEAMARLDAPWADVQDAYLRAWEFRPTRAERCMRSRRGTASISATGCHLFASVPRPFRCPRGCPVRRRRRLRLARSR
jgi:hypothetical protein